MMIRVALALIVAIALAGCASSGKNDSKPRPIPKLSFKTLDADESESVDREEFQKLTSAMFAKLDADGDGTLSPAEYKVLSQRPKPGQRRRGSGGRRGGGRRGGF